MNLAPQVWATVYTQVALKPPAPPILGEKDNLKSPKILTSDPASPTGARERARRGFRGQKYQR